MLMDFKIYLLTWNVVGRPPMDDLHVALGLQDPVDVSNLPDIFALGLQEVSSKPQDLISDLIFEDPWVTGFKDVLCKWNYVKIKQIRLLGIELFVFAKREHIFHIRNVQTTYTRAGLKGMWGNKGGVSIRLSAYGCSLCFVNSHLAAHDGEIQQRIDDYNLIIDKQKFVDPLTENIITHDYTFWIGDLNFRIDDFTAEEITHLIEKKSFSDLLSKDQLRKVMKLGQAFSEFVETPPPFPPTYKFYLDDDNYDIQKRKPAWTDRILFRSTPNAYENVTLSLKQLHYRSHPNYLQSDHKPVTASFAIKVFAEPEESRVNFFPISNWKVNEDSVAWYTFSSGVQPRSYDWIALFKADFTSLDEHVSYIWAPQQPSSHSPPVLATNNCNHDDENHLQQQHLNHNDQKQNCVTKSSVRSVQEPFYRVVFADQTLLIPGHYRLFYISAEFNNVLGISEPFQILPQE